MKASDKEEHRIFQILLKEEDQDDIEEIRRLQQAGVNEDQLPEVRGTYVTKNVRVRMSDIRAWWDTGGIDPLLHGDEELKVVPEPERITYTHVYGTNTGFEEDGAITLYRVSAADIDRLKGLDEEEMVREMYRDLDQFDENDLEHDQNDDQ